MAFMSNTLTYMVGSICQMHISHFSRSLTLSHKRILGVEAEGAHEIIDFITADSYNLLTKRCEK